MVKIRLSRAELYSNTRVRLARAELSGTAFVVPKVRLSRAELSGTTAIAVNTITTQTVEPGKTTTVTASLAGGGTADSWNWSQLSGPTVTLTGTGASRSFLSPAGFPPDGATVVLSVTATVGAATSPARSGTVVVLPELVWSRVHGGDWVGASR